MTVLERKELRERTHLEIAMCAAVSAGLASTEGEARKNMEQIIERNAPTLRTWWLRQRGGGIKGWLCFLRTFGFEERLEVRRIGGAPAQGQADITQRFAPTDVAELKRLQRN